MKKNCVFAQKNKYNNKLSVYYREGDKIIYLFETDYYKKFYYLYRSGISIEEVYRDKRWRKNKAMSRIIEHRLYRSLECMKGAKCYAK